MQAERRIAFPGKTSQEEAEEAEDWTMETAHKNARDSWKNHTSRESYNENESEVLSKHNPNHPSGLVEGFSSSVEDRRLG